MAAPIPDGVQFQRQPARGSAVTEKPSDGPRPRAQWEDSAGGSELWVSAAFRRISLAGRSLIRASVSAACQPAEQGLVGELRIGCRHRISLQQKSARMAVGEKAVKEEPAFPQREHDISRPCVCNRTTLDLNHVARPKDRQHALAVKLQAQAAAGAQNISG